MNYAGRHSNSLLVRQNVQVLSCKFGWDITKLASDSVNHMGQKYCSHTLYKAHARVNQTCTALAQALPLPAFCKLRFL